MTKEQLCYQLNLTPFAYNSKKEALKWWRWRELYPPKFHEWDKSPMGDRTAIYEYFHQKNKNQEQI